VKRLTLVLVLVLLAPVILAQAPGVADKLVGTNPGTVCASGSDAISVLPGTTVYYCYSFTNLLPKTEIVLFVDDDQLGSIIANRTVSGGGNTTEIRPFVAGLSDVTNIAVFRQTAGNSTFYNETATVSIQFPLQVRKSVSITPPPSCAGSTVVAVLAGSPLYYCYETTNLANTTLQYQIVDDQLGSIVANRSIGPLAGDMVWANTTLPVGVPSLTNVATWSVAGMASGSAAAQATANAIAPVPATSGTMLVLLGLALAVTATVMLRLR